MKSYVLINYSTKQYIGIDINCCGYPYDTEYLNNAKIWNKKEAAYEYAETFPNKDLRLHEVIVNDNEV